MSGVKGLAAAIDDVEAFDPAASVEELARRAHDLDVQLARLQAAHARAVAAADAAQVWAIDGSRSCAAWLARHRHCPRGRISGALKLGRLLRAMPRTAEAFERGSVTVDHVRHLAGLYRFCPSEFGSFEEQLVQFAATLEWHEFVQACARWCQLVDPDRDDRGAEKVRRDRHLFLDRRPDGSVALLSGLVDPLGGEAFTKVLADIERELFESDLAAAREQHGPDVPLSRLGRTATQRRADALAEMAYRAATAPADGKRPEPLIVVYVDYETVLGRMCQLASGTPLSPAHVAPLFTQADVERVVFGPGNRVIELGIRTRYFTGGLRRAVQLRDQHCQHPGCDVPAEQCQVDHIVSYAAGGLTTQENGRVYCTFHNLLRNRRPRGQPFVDPVTGEELWDPDDLVRRRSPAPAG